MNGGAEATPRVETILFSGPAGRLEGLWKAAPAPVRGVAVFAHPHPLFGGTLHNKVVYRAARALVAAGFSTLRFNFRGVGASEGRHDAGRGETGDVRAAFDEAERRGGPEGSPLVAGGFSFGAAAALRATAGDGRVAAFVGAGLPVAADSGDGLVPPGVPALFVTGEEDTFGPPETLSRWAASATPPPKVVIVPSADHFFAGHLDELESAIGSFLAAIPVGAAR